ncbi:hypothetical protein ASPCAL12658 [Aspergillus calidoustus]|uniref:Uncharacterized protein n=1 Tax=Aspergillus calidoustus TaxID=454130 RepID=A0A0U5GD53_ASPCI|nr:hypothetical protein ASPCAL12658 [Aspergillus calidoustus]
MSRNLSSASRIYGPLTSRPLCSSLSPAAIIHPTLSVQTRLNSGITKDWKGSSGEKHATHRIQKENDATDPQTIGSGRTMEDREKNYGTGNTGTSDAATERGGRKNERKVKQDHPKAPEPVLGMNDERAQKGV